jgi:signal peptidase I
VSGGEKKETNWKKELLAFLAAIVVLMAIFAGLYLYSGVWPPMVVVESGSMAHSTDRSYIGVIDTGDLVIVRDQSSVVTYVEGYVDHYRKFGDYGDVVIYLRYGQEDSTPVIHRAIIELVYNESTGLFDVPSLQDYPTSLWSHDGIQDGQWSGLGGSLELYDVGYRSQSLRVDLDALLFYQHSGYITKGDHNDLIDQNTMMPVCRELVDQGWIVGVAKGEIPWFGLLKLWVGGQYAPYGPGVPSNSWTNLFVCIALIIIIPISIDLLDVYYRRRGKDPFAPLRKENRSPPPKQVVVERDAKKPSDDRKNGPQE